MPLLDLFHHFKIYMCIRCLKDFIFTRDDETRDPILSEIFRKKNIGMSWFEACNEINIATCIFKRFSGCLYDKLFNIVVGKSYVAKCLAR